jgi:hypothetical protein
MKRRDFHTSIAAGIPPAEALARISRVSERWTKGFTGRSQQPGGTFTVRFGETFVDFEVAGVVADRKIVWHVTDCNLHWLKDKKEWNDTKVVWDVSPGDKATTISMTHEGLVPEVECYGTCQAGWTFYVEKSLFKFLTENEGLPDVRRGSE